MAGRNHSIIIDTSVKNGYNMNPNQYGDAHKRIVKANKEAKKRGISYGRYMAGLWEDKERLPVCKNIERVHVEHKNEKPKAVEKRILTGDEAADYIRALKIKAGTYTEPKAVPKSASGHQEYEKAKKLNNEWSDVCNKLRVKIQRHQKGKI